MGKKSGIVWLASSSAEISQARQVLSSLKQSEVLDELGFTVLQGAIAGRLYPGTSTIMTRARYLVFIPAIYRHLERTGKAKGRDADRVTRGLQAELCNSLVKANPKDLGIIGREARGDVARTASNVYWRVLSDLGIATQHIYEATYLSKLSSGQFGPDRAKDDDDGVVQGDSQSLWDATFPTVIIHKDGSFPSDISFALTRHEACALRQRYASLSPADEPSLLSHTISYYLGRSSGDEVLSDLPWSVPQVPVELARVLDHARKLSLFARGVTLQYHQMLIEKKEEDDRGIGTAFKAWWTAAHAELEEWDLADFIRLANRLKGLRQNDSTFLSDWRTCVSRERSANSLLGSISARDVVAAREARQRPTKGRLRSVFHLKSWKPFDTYSPDDIYQLHYRHRVGRIIAGDIIAGLKGRQK